MPDRTYLCIDLKSFYASVECVEMGLDPLEADLVVADPERTDRTICLAVSPHLKAQGVRNRCRVYEIPKRIPYIMAPPRMQKYIDYSARIYGVYLKYASKEDIHVYSIDEVFLDATAYMGFYKMDPRQFAQMIMQDVLDTTGITATCGIGTNLYLAKIALDIISKHAPDHIGVLTEESFREQLWDHLPLSDFWSISTGTINWLDSLHLHTMRDIAFARPERLYQKFGVNAELLIDHAWGRESCTIADIKAYRPKSNSLSTGQILHQGYDKPGGRLLFLEMAEQLSHDLVKKAMVTNAVSISMAYSFSSDLDPAKGTLSLGAYTSSTRRILEAVGVLYDRVAVADEPIFHAALSFPNLKEDPGLQYDLFSPVERQVGERAMQQSVVALREKYGKNSLIKGMDLLPGGRTIERNSQIGGHRA